MITWSLTLTGNQIRCLQCLKGRVYGVEDSGTDAYHQGLRDISHWAVGLRVLIKEGLIEHRHELKKPDRLGGRYTDPARSGQFLTERGRFMLNFIETDIERFLSDQPKQKKKKRKARR